MRIDSSTIGMESERSYTSVSRRVSRFTITNSRQSLEDGAGALLGNLADSDVEGEETQAKEKETPLDAWKNALEEMRAKTGTASMERIHSTGISDVHEQLMEIRQQCLNYLMKIFFPERQSSILGSTEQIQGYEQTSSTQDAWIAMAGVGTKTYTYSSQYYYEESESTSFRTQGTVKCADGREISFNLNLEMSRSFQEYYEENVSYMQTSMCDPLIINLNGNIADLSDQTFFFDLDGDGQEDEINRLAKGSGFLALDKNGDGVINDGTELFGAQSGDGFADLAAYDTDHNGFIDEGDEIWDKLKIWVMDENGNQQLYTLKEKGVGAICLQNSAANFAITDEQNQTRGMIRKTGVFLFENGNAGTVQHVDMTLYNQKQQEEVRRNQSKYAQWLYEKLHKMRLGSLTK